MAAKESVWLRDVLMELGFKQKKPTILNQGNQSSIAFSMSEVNHSKMKHIALKESFLRELVCNGVLKSQYVSSCENPADLFTKNLGVTKFTNFDCKLLCPESG